MLDRKIPLAFLCGLLALSIYGIYSFSRIPPKVTRYIPDYNYQQNANFNCTIEIEPSTLYENRTLLTPDDIIYPSLAKNIHISFNYQFICDQPTEETKIHYRVDGILEAEGGWRKNITLTEEKTTNQTTLSEDYLLDIDNINDLINKIERETRVTSPKYTFKIVPHINLEATIGNRTITEKFDPAMSITFTNRLIEFNGLKHSRPGTLGHYEKTENPWFFHGFTTTVRNMRYASYATTASLTACLALLLYQFIKSPPPPLMEKIRKDYGEKIVDSLGPSKRVGKVTIRVKSMKDLDKVSEETIRPIIHEESIIEKEGLKVKRHILYVLDDDVRYEFTFEEKSPEDPNATKRS